MMPDKKIPSPEEYFDTVEKEKKIPSPSEYFSGSKKKEEAEEEKDFESTVKDLQSLLGFDEIKPPSRDFSSEQDATETDQPKPRVDKVDTPTGTEPLDLEGELSNIDPEMEPSFTGPIEREKESTQKALGLNQSKDQYFKELSEEFNPLIEGNLEFIDQELEKITQDQNYLSEEISSSSIGYPYHRTEKERDVSAERMAQYRNLKAAQRLFNDSRRFINANSQEDVNNFLEGLKSKTTIDYLSAGLSETFDEVNIALAAKKQREGKTLSKDERLALSAKHMLTSLQHSKDTEMSYNIGMVLAEAVPYLVQIAMTSGVGASAKGASQAAMKKALKDKMEKNIVLKFSSKAMDEAVGAAAQTPFFHSMWGGAAEKYSMGEEGKQVSGREAVLDSYVNTWAEIFPERMGGLVAGKSVNKIKGAKKSIKDLFQWQGTMVEFHEEQWTTVLQAVTTGDANISDLTDIEKQFETFVSVAAMGGAFKVMEMPGYIASGRHKSNFKNVEKRFNDTFGSDLKQEIEGVLEKPTVEEKRKALGELGLDVLPPNQQGLILEYFKARVENDAINSVEESLEEDPEIHDNETEISREQLEGEAQEGADAPAQETTEVSQEVQEKVKQQVAEDEAPSYQIGEKVFEDKNEFLTELDKYENLNEVPEVTVNNDDASLSEVNTILQSKQTEQTEVEQKPQEGGTQDGRVWQEQEKEKEQRQEADEEVDTPQQPAETLQTEEEVSEQAEAPLSKEDSPTPKEVSLSLSDTPKSKQRVLKTGEGAKTSPIKKGNQEVGEVTVDKDWRVKRIDVEKDFQRQGIAKDTYRKLNQEAQKNNTTLKSDQPDKINDESKRIWESLVKSNEAQKLDDGSYEFIRPAEPVVAEQKKQTQKPKAKDNVGQSIYYKEFGSETFGEIVEDRGDKYKVKTSEGETMIVPKKGNNMFKDVKVGDQIKEVEKARAQAKPDKDAQDRVRAVTDIVSKAFPGIDVITNKERVPENIRGAAGGFVGGKIYINPDMASRKTPIHEFGHLWTGIAKQKDPYLIKRVEDEVKQTDVFNQLKEDADYANLTEQELVEEAFVRTISEKGMERLSTGPIKSAARSMMDKVRGGLKAMGVDPGVNLSSMTLDKLSNVAAKEILSKRPLSSNTSVEVDQILTKKRSGNDLVVSNSILADKGNRRFKERVLPFVSRNLKTSRGLTYEWRDDIEGMGTKLSAITQDIGLKMQHLNENLIRGYRKKHSLEKTGELVQRIGDVHSGNTPVNSLPTEFRSTVADIIRDEKAFVDMMKENLILRGDVIGALNPDLNLFLTENFNRKEDYNSVEAELLDQHQAENRELLSLSEDQFNDKWTELQNRKTEVEKELLRVKIQEVEGRKALFDTMREDTDSKTAALLTELDKAKVELDRVNKLEYVEGDKKFKKDKERADLKKQLKERQEELKQELETPEEYNSNQVSIMEEISSINETISEVLADKPKGLTRESLGKVLEDIQNKEILTNKKNYDLGLVDFVQYGVTEDGFGITFNHRDGHKHEVDKRLSREDAVELFGEPAVRKMENQEAGIHKFLTPQELLNNPLYERIKKNDADYVHRSYMMHDVENFKDNVIQHVGQDVYDKAITHIRSRYEDHRVASVRKDKREDGTTEYVFKNVYGIESSPFESGNISEYLRDIGVSQEDINAFEKTGNGVDFHLRKPTSYWTQTGIDNFTLPAHKIDEILSDILETASMDAVFGNDPLGRKVDHKVFKRRKNIEPEIRELMGEYTNPMITIPKTMMKMGAKAASDRFAIDFINKGIRDGIVTEKQTKHHTKRIPSEKMGYPESKTFYTTPEVYDFLFDVTQGPGKTERFFMFFNGLAKMNFTVNRGASQTRNAWGAMGNMWAATGSFNPYRNVGKVYEALSQKFHGNEGLATYLSTPMFMMRIAKGKKFGNKGDKEIQELLFEFTEQGLMEGSVMGAPARELSEILSSSDDPNVLIDQYINSKGSAKDKLKKVLGAASKTYQLSDEVFKCMQYLHEKDVYKRAGYDEMTARRVAANIAKNTQPHYQRAPRLFKLWSRNPVGGSFVMFKAEMFRTRWNILNQGISEMKSGNKVLEKHGRWRLVGLATQSVATLGVRTAAMAMLGITDQEDEAVRYHMAEYNRNNALVYLNNDLTNPKYLDFTFIDPGSAYTNSFIALFSDREKPIMEAGGELVGEFFVSEIATQSIAQLLMNKNEYGQDIVLEDDSPAQKTAKRTGHLLKWMAPGEARDIYRIFQAAISPDQGTYQLSWKDESLNRILGIKVKKRNMETNIMWMNKDFYDRMKESRGVFYKDISTKTYMDARRRTDELFEKMHKSYVYAHYQGFSNTEIENIFKKAGVSKFMIEALRRGYMQDEDYKLDINR